MRVVTHAVPWIAIPLAVILALRSLKSIASVNPVSGTLTSVSTWFRQLPTIVGVTGVVKLATKVAMMSDAALVIAPGKNISVGPVFLKEGAKIAAGAVAMITRIIAVNSF